MLTKLISPFFERIIDLKQKEYKKVILLQLTIFLIISVLLILKPLATSLMLNAYGLDIMPVAFGGIAIAAIIIHFILLIIRKKFSLVRSMYINFCFHIILIIGLSVAFVLGKLTGWLTVLMYVYINLFSVLTVTLFFQYCQSLLSIREAKRVLSYVGVWAIAGGVFGGYFASALVPLLGNLGLLLSAIFFLTIATLSLRLLQKEYGTDLVDAESNKEVSNSFFFKTLGNKHVAYIAAIIGLGVMASKLLDYQFNAVAYAHYVDEEQLTSFLAFWFSTINVVSLLLQLFLVNTIIDRLGISYSMSIMPFLFLFSLLAFFYIPILAIGAAMKMIDGSLKQSLYKTSTEINIMPLPNLIRDRAKTLVDLVVDSLATGLSGIIIYVLIQKVILPLSVITATTIGIVVLWLVFIRLSRKTYLAQLSKLVFKNDDDYEELETTPQQYIQSFIHNKPRKTKERFDILISLTKDKKAPIRAAALSTISEEYNLDALQKLQHLKTDKSIVIRKQYFLETLQYVNTKVELNKLYSSAQAKNKIVLTGALAKSIGNRKRQQKNYSLSNRIEQAYELLTTDHSLPKILWRTFMTAVAHSRYEKFYPIIIENINQTTDDEMKKYALFAIRKAKVKSLFDFLIESEVKPNNLNAWYKSLSAFPNLLLQYFNNNPITQKNLLRTIPALGYVGSQPNLDFLFKSIHHPKRKIRIAALLSISKMKKEFPFLNYNKRKNLLRLNRSIVQCKSIINGICLINKFTKIHKEDSNNMRIIKKAHRNLRKDLNVQIHTIFILLELKLDSDEMIKCYKGLRSGNAQATMDYLDQLLPYRIRLKVLPILELSIAKNITDSLMKSKGIKVTRKNTSIKYLRKLHSTKYEEVIKLI